jgi:hypothetical protein
VREAGKRRRTFVSCVGGGVGLSIGKTVVPLKERWLASSSWWFGG